MSLRILHISTRLILGGSQENTVLSCEGQARAGHDVHLAFGPIYGPEGSLLERVQRFRTADGRRITTHIVPNMVRQIAPLKDRRGRRELYQLVRELKPDIVHTHSSKAGIIGRAAAFDAFMKSSRGIVHTVHGPPFMPVEGSLLRRTTIAATNLGYVFAERYAAKRCAMIVSVADAMTELFLSKGIGRREQYLTVHSGMETARYLNAAPGENRVSMRRELGLSDSDIVIGTVARLAEHKGHDDLLDALGPELKARPDIKLLWVGDGWWRDRLIARARTLGMSIAELDKAPASTSSLRHSVTPSLPAQLILTGLIPSERVPAHIRAMDILAHPSYREGLPRTVPQALLCGVVPVAYDVDGTREACIDRQTGRLVTLGDRQALRQAILELADAPQERARLADAGRELCRTRFSAETMVAALAKVYERALNGSQG